MRQGGLAHAGITLHQHQPAPPRTGARQPTVEARQLARPPDEDVLIHAIKLDRSRRPREAVILDLFSAMPARRVVVLTYLRSNPAARDRDQSEPSLSGEDGPATVL